MAHTKKAEEAGKMHSEYESHDDEEVHAWSSEDEKTKQEATGTEANKKKVSIPNNLFLQFRIAERGKMDF
ncbi:hypothetical protein E2562_018499 [Oryza meyeriana var. granulata]|uniref:Uncharacterized protein n=1 Tax=Oryza meyeriana var. granulata TaxID=110450 RepID=A0A6G1EML8_9ORYZ|nr:hypothetical protein E2562_018499 [Oryza meyeriana var. granulata]